VRGRHKNGKAPQGSGAKTTEPARDSKALFHQHSTAPKGSARGRAAQAVKVLEATFKRGDGEALHVELREYNGKKFIRLTVYRSGKAPTYTTIRQSELAPLGKALAMAQGILGGGNGA